MYLSSRWAVRLGMTHHITDVAPGPLRVDAQQRVLAWGRGASRPVPAVTLSRLFNEIATALPDHTAVVHHEALLTYGQLKSAVDELAARLRHAGVGRESSVGVCLSRGPLLVQALLAILAAGGAFVPLDPGLPAARLTQMLTDTDPIVCLVDAQTRDTLPARTAPLIEVTPGWLPSDAGSDAGSVAASVAGSVAGLAAGMPGRPTDLAYVMFTSGSTGRPKGICIEQRSLVDFAVNNAAVYGVTADSRVLALASIGFDVSVAEIFTALVAGATLVIADEDVRNSPIQLRELLIRQRITVAELPPSVLGLLDPAEFPDLQLVSVGGEAPPAPHVATWVRAGKRLINAYGPTETTVTATLFDCTSDRVATVPIGRPMANHTVYVLDGHGDLVDPEVPGELWVAGPGVARGYLHQPKLTAQRFRPDPFSRKPGRMYGTGDRVVWNEDGNLEFLGRVDGQLNLHGFRIEPGDIETRLRAHHALGDAAVTVVGDGEAARLVAFVVGPAGVTWDLAAESAAELAAELTQWCRAALPAYLVPTSFVALAALPITVSGKVDRATLANSVRRGGDRVGSSDHPRNPLEQRLFEIWREVLPAVAFGVHDSFLDIGGHSLLAMRALVRIRSEFGIELTIATLAVNPTIAELAGKIALFISASNSTIAERATAITLATPASDPIQLSARQLDTAPLSFAQQRLWFLDQVSPGEATYNLPICLELHGPLDPLLLREAFARVVERHDTMRTAFVAVAGRPAALVAAAVPVELQITDLSGFGPVASWAERERIVRAAVSQPFALDTAPLWRLQLIRNGPLDWVLIVVVHHAIADGWSLSVLLDEFGKHYRQLTAGPDAAAEKLVPLVSQYGDYARWQRETTTGERAQHDIEHWRDVLSGAPTALNLPTDRPRPRAQTFTPGRVGAAIPAEISAGIDDLAQRQGITPFAALLALFNALVGRLAGTDDVVVACPVAGRPEPALEKLIGFFVDTVPVRVDISGDLTLTGLLTRTSTALVDALSHATVPFDLIVAAVKPGRDVSRNPLVQIAFNQLDYPTEHLALPGVAVATIDVAPPGSLFDATMYVRPTDSGRSLELVYNADLFDADRMSELLGQFLYLLEQAGRAPDQRPIATFSLVTPVGRDGLPDPTAVLPSAPTVAVLQRFRSWVVQTPEAIAVESADVVLSYRALDLASDAVAIDLIDRGVRPGDVVAVAAVRSPLLAVAILGARKAGTVVALLDAGHPSHRLVELARVTRPVAWIDISVGSDHSQTGQLTAVLAEHLADRRISRLTVNGAIAGGSRRPPVLIENPADPAFVLCTSGSTGTPAAVVVPAGALPHFVDWYQAEFDLGPGDRFSVVSGLAHDPILRDLLVPLCIGATACVPAPDTHRASDMLAAWLSDQRITVTHLTPQIARLLCRSAADRLPPQANSLRLVACGGDVLPGADISALAGFAPAATTVLLYGATETPQAVAWQLLAGQQERVCAPIGTGIAGVQLLVLTPAGGQAGVGELGEIHVRSAHLAIGYLNDPALTADRFTAETGAVRRYRTGDLGRYLPDGRVEFCGRRDSQLKIRGFRVETVEVVKALEGLDSVIAAVVAPTRTSAGEVILVGYVVLNAGSNTVNGLRDQLRLRLPEWSVPSILVPVQAIPLTGNGKVDVAALPELTRRDPTATNLRPPQGKVEQAIVAIWCGVLGLSEVGIDDSFFDVGGTSLRLVEVASQLRNRLNRSISVVDLFQFPTVRGLAAHLSVQAGDTTFRSAATVRRIDQRRVRRGQRSRERPVTN